MKTTKFRSNVNATLFTIGAATNPVRKAVRNAGEKVQDTYRENREMYFTKKMMNLVMECSDGCAPAALLAHSPEGPEFTSEGYLPVCDAHLIAVNDIRAANGLGPIDPERAKVLIPIPDDHIEIVEEA